MKHKGKVLELFVKWKNMDTSTGRKSKVLRSDNRREYTGDPFLQLYCDEGIERYFTVKKTLQQNRAAERINMTLLDKV